MKETEGLIVRALEQENVKKIVIKKLKDNVIEIFTDGKKNGTGRYYSPKIKGYSQFKDYSRHPIQLSAQNIILIHHFKDDGGLEQVFECQDMGEENEAYWKDSMDIYKTAAEQFFNQMEGHCCDAFLEAMIVEATKQLDESDKSRKIYIKPNDDSACNRHELRAKKALEKAAEAIK
jgi:hypothetical protein